MLMKGKHVAMHVRHTPALGDRDANRHRVLENIGKHKKTGDTRAQDLMFLCPKGTTHPQC